MEEFKGCDAEAEKDGDGKSNTGADHKPLIVHGTFRRLTGPARRASKANWTEEEDSILQDAVQRYKGKCWKKIAECLPGRTDVQCLHRWQKVLNPDLVKGPWSKEEDNLLIELVGKQGKNKWSEIAERLPGRIGKQCRERWFNHLNPEIKKAAWTKEEEMILINAHRIYGNKWSEISKFLPGRTENSIKNHWNCSLKKQLDNYLASGSALNDPRFTVPALHGNKTETSGKVVEANQNPSTKCLRTDNMDSSKNDGESCCLDLVLGHSSNLSSCPPSSGKVNNPVRLSPLTCSKMATTSHPKVVDCALLDENNSPYVRLRRHSDTGDSLGVHQCSSDLSYTGLCYEPILLSTGSYSRQPNRSISVPPSRSHMKSSSSDLYSSPESILRRAAMSYDNMPSIIRKRAIQTLKKDVSSPDKVVGSLNRQEVTEGDEDEDRTLRQHAVFSPKYQKLEQYAAIKSVGKCLEKAFSDA